MRLRLPAFALASLFAITLTASTARAADLEPIAGVEHQPFVAATQRLIEALEYVGSPLSEDEIAAIETAYEMDNTRESVMAIQEVIDPRCIAQVTINAESRVSAIEGPGSKELIQQGWRACLIKVHNQAGITPELMIESPQSAPVYQQGQGARQAPQSEADLVTSAESALRFLDISPFNKPPMRETLSGLECEYVIVHLYSRDVGRREATLSFHVGQGTQDLGFRGEVPILFHCVPAVEVGLGVYDHDGQPTMAAFVIRDSEGRVYPNPARRLAPDFFFHEQIYRGDGESVFLPPGEYSVAVSRGPEYLVEHASITVPDGVVSHREEFYLSRWVFPRLRGWYSGDHHVHAAGCAHYDSPTEGVGPGDMLRHILGEDLNVGCVLSWGPCWYTQKQYFEGRTSSLSRPNYLMRYDVEVSGFPSSHAGHLCLLRLTEDDYPGTTYLEEWPSWTLPVLAWGKEQNAIVGYSHSGWGLALPDVMPDGSREFSAQPWGGAPEGWDGVAASTLPDYAMPRFDGIGANEYVVTTAHGVCDFISAVDTPAIWELNIWYHTLNCGMTSRISGETDFPCIYGDRVGLGRIYVALPEGVPLDFDSWAEGVRNGRSYCGDGLSHLFDFRVNDVEIGAPGTNGEISQLELDSPQMVEVAVDVAAMLEPEITDATERIRNARLDTKPYWHIERCRIGDTRTVPVEVIVNGQVVETVEIEADGSTQPLSIPVEITQSSWVAVRILPSCHTNPVFVIVDDAPIRASRRSAQWCIDAVDVCWASKENQIREEERVEAETAYQEAKAIYEAVLEETEAE